MNISAVVSLVVAILVSNCALSTDCKHLYRQDDAPENRPLNPSQIGQMHQMGQFAAQKRPLLDSLVLGDARRIRRMDSNQQLSSENKGKRVRRMQDQSMFDKAMEEFGKVRNRDYGEYVYDDEDDDDAKAVESRNIAAEPVKKTGSSFWKYATVMAGVWLAIAVGIFAFIVIYGGKKSDSADASSEATKKSKSRKRITKSRKQQYHTDSEDGTVAASY